MHAANTANILICRSQCARCITILAMKASDRRRDACEDLAVLARPGSPGRRAEVAGVAEILRSLGLRIAAVQEPATLEGGDVLQSGHTVYAGRGGRTNGAGIRQLRALLAPLGRTVIAVPLATCCTSNPR